MGFVGGVMMRLGAEHDFNVVHIHVPYLKAGKRFGWNGRFQQVGLGFQRRFLRGGGRLRVRVGRSEQVYSLDKLAARAIHRKYDSVYEARGYVLAVLPWSAFEKE